MGLLAQLAEHVDSCGGKRTGHFRHNLTEFVDVVKFNEWEK